MTSASISLRIFGFSMRTRSSRRRLVVVTYVALALVCVASAWFVGVTPAVSSYAVWAAVLVGAFVFGGQGRFGLVKPFLNKPPRPDLVERIVFSEPVLLNLLPAMALPTSSADWKNDERELALRDRVHYQSFPWLGLALVLILMLASWTMHHPDTVALPTLVVAIYIIALAGTILAFTLPSALILWSEPDRQLPEPCLSLLSPPKSHQENLR
jgi:hypothetical protein